MEDMMPFQLRWTINWLVIKSIEIDGINNRCRRGSHSFIGHDWSGVFPRGPAERERRTKIFMSLLIKWKMYFHFENKILFLWFAKREVCAPSNAIHVEKALNILLFISLYCHSSSAHISRGNGYCSVERCVGARITIIHCFQRQHNNSIRDAEIEVAIEAYFFVSPFEIGLCRFSSASHRIVPHEHATVRVLSSHFS